MADVDRLMQQAVADSVFPGGVILVSREHRVLFCRAYGHANRLTRRTMTATTLFDLASLTKPLATTLAVMLLYQRGRIDVAAGLESVLPAFAGSDKAGVTLAQLLSHTSGLPDYRPYHAQLATRPFRERPSALQELLRREPLAHRPGERVLYSDLDFMILGWVVEAAGGKRLDRFVAEEVYAPLGVDDLLFIDLQRGRPAAAFAATEACSWCGRILEGEVHDENAHVLGGVAGHAGLFGTAAAVDGLIAELLQAYHGPAAARLYHGATVRRFLARVPGTDKTLGFDMPTPPNPSCGRFFPETSVGHLGFTGTSFWVDIERRIRVVLLTNRVHPTRANTAIRAFRPAIHDAVMRAIGAAA
ncbi:MAG: serine hydrolase [Deltaproteobacteria bacterium]|nr:serine hydrolase [Deltaproteobacteria bacterium]